MTLFMTVTLRDHSLVVLKDHCSFHYFVFTLKFGETKMCVAVFQPMMGVNNNQKLSQSSLCRPNGSPFGSSNVLIVDHVSVPRGAAATHRQSAHCRRVQQQDRGTSCRHWELPAAQESHTKLQQTQWVTLEWMMGVGGALWHHMGT